ncbi:hypothetical protein [Natrialba taiwanensis]|uniref:Uncharacterized protein n=1 Tax=Natrialba taiwanensis DSM 12281 TaxID=1230458 RepID=L9ZJK5_9EURY|nr:hypothetical protein [Natrialba taiwanensis]ELY86504.1 hypothetical protein C484_18052 [Natrialba taiwanensis DSM 12281]
MPPDGYSTVTVSDEVLARLIEVMTKYDCDSIADAVETASIIALERDEVELAQILGDRLQE